MFHDIVIFDVYIVIYIQITLVVMYRYKLTIEYNGYTYHGWQKQGCEEDYNLNEIDFNINNCNDKSISNANKFNDNYRSKNNISNVNSKVKTIQYVLENAIFSLTGERVRLYAAGRTDAGVHAIGQVAHFDLSCFWLADKLITGINYFLKHENIVILSCEAVDLNFHARFSAVERAYKYKIDIRNSPCALNRHKVCWLRKGLDVKLLNKCLVKLKGSHDFQAFKAVGCQAKSSIIDIRRLYMNLYLQDEDNIWHKQDLSDYNGDCLVNCRVEIVIVARSFLYKLIRNLVGAIINISQGFRDIKHIDIMLNTRDRQNNVFMTQVPYGLYFLYAKY